MPKRRDPGVEAFIDEDNEGIEILDEDDISDEEMEKLMANNKTKKKIDDEIDDEVEPEEEDEDEDESEDEVEDEDEDEDDDDEEELEPSGFTPWIAAPDQSWELTEALEAAAPNVDPIIIYDVVNDRWYKMMPIKVGELPADAS